MTDVLTCPQCHAELPDNAPAGLCPRCLMEAALAESSDENQARADSPYAETTPQPRSFLPPDSGVLADQFPHLEILELLGQGGMGAVYKARQPKLDRLVALKIIRPESADDPAFAERFNREARTLARLSHPNIVAVHDFGEVMLSQTDADESPRTLYYFLMEYVDGANLRQLMDRGELSLEQTLQIVPQICDALQFAHDEGVVHRDIKPENILVDSRGRVKIADFGLAKLASPSEHDFTLTGTHQVMGTPRYMAPEQMAGSRAVDHRADLYSLGVVFYEMLTGEIPAGHFSSPSQHAAIDERLDDVVMKALAQKPEDRFQSAREIRASLEAISQEPGGAVFSQAGAPELPPARGFSTIFEREAGAAWNWVVHPARAGRDSDHTESPAFPLLLFFTLSLLGGLTMLLPWAEIQIPQAADVSRIDETARLLAPVTQSFSGTDIWSSTAAPGMCLLVGFVLLLSPHRRSPGWIATGLMTVFSVVAVIHTSVYPNELKSHGTARFEVEVSEQAARWLTGTAGVGDGAIDPKSRVVIRPPILLRTFPEYVTYREGYYAALGISLSLVLLSIIGVRNAILNQEPKPKTQESWAGTPVASLRFTVPVKGEIGSKIRFHFLGLGYELEQERPGSWIFQRGTFMGGMMQADIRTYPTRLSVNSIEDDEGQYLVNCHWSVRLMGGGAGKKDIAMLEDEGRELQSLLGGPLAQTEHGPATPSPAMIDPPHGIVPEPVEEAPIITAGKEQTVVRPVGMDLSAVEDEVRGPAVAMIVSGLLLMIGHTIAAIVFANSNDPTVDAWAWLAIPGILVGIMMLAGGIGLHGARSQSWAQAGIIGGFLPVTPAWFFTMMVSTWAANVLSRPQVKMGFVERKHRRWEKLKRQRSGHASSTGSGIDVVAIEEEVSGPSIAMMTVGLLIVLGHLALFVFSILSRYDREMAPLALPGLLIGIGMLVGGLHLHQLWSRGWAQLGVIAGLIPASGGWLLSLPLSLWALKVLSRQDVKAAFLQRKRDLRDDGDTVPSATETPDFSALEEEINGPSLALIVTGSLIGIGHAIWFYVGVFNPHDREMAALAVPGFLVGVLMSVSGFLMRGFGSRGWIQLGLIAGMLPINAGWLLSLPICLWANSVFGRRDVKQAFLERKRGIRPLKTDPSQPEEPRPSRVRSAILIALVAWSVLIIVGGMASFAWLRNELSESEIRDYSTITLVPNSGAYQQVKVNAQGADRSQLRPNAPHAKYAQLRFQLTPLKYSRYGGGTGVLEVELPSLGWRAPLRDGTEIGSPVGFTPDAIKEWMGLSGVDLNVEGVDKEARALFAIAEYGHQKSPDELADRSLFNVPDSESGSFSKLTRRYQEWQHAQYCFFVWLVGVLIVLMTVFEKAGKSHSDNRRLLQFAMMFFVVVGASLAASVLLYLARSEGRSPTVVQEATKGGPLHVAAAAGQIGRIRQVLRDLGTDINDKDSQGKTPLMYAAENNQKSTVLALIVLGANLEETDPNGRNAVMLAAAKGHADLLLAMDNLADFAAECRQDNATPGQSVKRFQEFPGIDRDILQEVKPHALRFRIPVKVQDNEGMTAAMMAAANGDIKCLEALWSLGGLGDDCRQDRQGRTVLMHGLLNGHNELVLKFLEGFVKTDPAELSAVDQQGRSLYDLAEERGATEVTGRMRQLLTEEVEKYTKLVESNLDYQTFLNKLLKALETTQKKEPSTTE